MSDALRIIYLQAENVKRLRAVRIKPDKTLVRIEGRNAQGKTSVLDAIAAALGGGKWQPDKPVREGERKASVSLDLGELLVERRWTASGNSTLEVTSKGTKLASPQAILDKLVGDLTFDPLAFVRMKPKEQADLLRNLAGLDFSALDSERETAFNERTVVNRDLKAAETRVGSVPPKPKTTSPMVVSQLVADQQAALKHNAEIDAISERLRTADSDFSREADNTKTSRESMQAEIKRLTDRLSAFEANQKDKLARLRTSAETMRTELQARERVDVERFSSMIADAEIVNRAIREYADYESRAKVAQEKQTEADKLTARLEAIDDEKARKLCQAKFPLDGLSVGPEGPTLNGIPFSQASSAEQLRTSVAIGLSQKPRCRIMLCRDGSLLDNAGMESLHKIAVEFDAQCFVERVADTKSPSAVYIEDGEVVDNE